MSTLKGGGTDLDNAAKAIGLAILFDSFDGFVARATGTSSEFGKQFDSLADMVSFGIAPAALGFTWGVRAIAETQALDIRRLHEIGWWVALVFVICCAWRLARFNIQGMAPGTGSKYFVGLPCPAAAGLIAATVHAIKSPIEDWRWSIFWMLIVIADAALMSSTVRYRSFKDLPMAARQRSIFVIFIALLVWLIVAYSEVVLMVIAPLPGFASRQDMIAPKEADRVAIAGASSLLGKELNLWLEESKFPAIDIRLVDEEIVAGTLTEAGGEPTVIETVAEDSFERARFAFFTGSPDFARRHAAEARRAGAVVIDLSGGLEADAKARLWIPALDGVLSSPAESVPPGEAQSLFVVPSAPADVAISISAALAPAGLERLVVTVLQPVSEAGAEAVQELESQVVKLLSFQPVSQTVFDAQVGFNLLSSYGPESRIKLADARAKIASESRRYLVGRAPVPAIMLVQAPVFYSHAFTAYAEFKAAPDLDDLSDRLRTAGLKVARAKDEPPTNVNIVGEVRPVLRQPERDPGIETGVWLWGAADNLRVPAATAVAIAEQLLAS
jgi:CDP-diacylglycerol--serine O-phosphatidyltransferase